MDGKPLNDQPPPVSYSGSKDKRPNVLNSNAQSSAASSSQSNSRESQGKLVFGSNVDRIKEAGKVTRILRANI